MIEEFVPYSKVDTKAFETFNAQLQEILERLDEDTLLKENIYSEESFTKLLKSFVSNQRSELGRTKSGSWSLAPDDKGMDADARVDFIFTPTYLVTAILSRTLCDHPLLTQSIPNYKEALRKGMTFCSYRNLSGHGYEKDFGAAKALTILSLGKVPMLLENEKELCPELYKSIKVVTNKMIEQLKSESAQGLWGESLQDDFNSALETLYIKNDKKTYDAITSTDKKNNLINEEDLLW